MIERLKLAAGALFFIVLVGGGAWLLMLAPS
jgi:hypothetical protein